MSYDIKQVIVVRKDLKMSVGKLASQVAHASMIFLAERVCPINLIGRVLYESAQKPVFNKHEQEWINGTFAKVVVGVQDEQELLGVLIKAQSLRIKNVSMVTDAGKTEFNGVPTHTCIAIGPDAASRIDMVTGDLKLL